jgi:hypothetical protein
MPRAAKKAGIYEKSNFRKFGKKGRLNFAKEITTEIAVKTAIVVS